MLVHQGNERTDDANRRLAWSLAGIAGCVNASGFYAVGLYSSHMTGTISTMADHLALGNWVAVAVGLGVVACFVSGAITSTLLINHGQRRRLAHIYALSILLEAMLLAVVAAADLWLGAGRSPILIFGLSFLMGVQNATVTRISDARVRTTHVTGMVTDIGIELGHLIDVMRRRRLGGKADTTKLKLHVPAVLSFFFGGVLGVLVYRRAGAVLLLAAAAALMALALPGLRQPRRQGDRRPVAMP